jgi:CRP-like cAMP-binding protein
VAYDTSPGEATSERVAHALRKLGWRDVRILKGGLGGWTNAKLPMEAKSSLPSIGIELYKNLTLGDMEKRHFDKGTVICKEGDDPHGEAYLVHAGAVEIRRRENGTFRVLTQLGEGQLVGQMALFRKERRSADIVAATDVDLLVIKQERLEWLIHNRPEVTVEILKSLSDDVARANRQGGASPPQQ